MLVKQYKFAFAWENANCDGYVTEKLARVFEAGVLPIVDGPEDYSPFIPSNRSVIRVDSFSSPKALANYLKMLANDDDLYRQHFDYKPSSLQSLSIRHNNPTFLAYDTETEYGECQLCRKVAAELKSDGLKKKIMLDVSCTRRKWDREYYDDGTMSNEPMSLWIEEWGFGLENNVLTGIVLALLILVALLIQWLLRRRRQQRITNTFSSQGK